MVCGGFINTICRSYEQVIHRDICIEAAIFWILRSLNIFIPNVANFLSTQTSHSGPDHLLGLDPLVEVRRRRPGPAPRPHPLM